MVGAVIGGAISAVGGIGSSLISGSKAAGGSQQSQYLQLLEQQQNQVNTAPFIGAGQYGVNALQAGLQSGRFGQGFNMAGAPSWNDMPQFTGPLPTAPDPFVWNPTMEGLAQTPGYQFTLDQGLRATQSSAAARGLGMSGAAMRGAADYASGKASETYNQQLTNAINTWNTGLNRYQQQIAGYGQGVNAWGALQGTFQNQFNDYWGNQNNAYKQLTDLATIGANSAAAQGTTGTTAAQNIGNAAQAAGNAQAAGIQGAGNALSNFANSAVVQNALSGSGKNANNQSVTGGGIGNSFSGLGSYFSGSGNYYNPGAGYSPGAYDPTFAPGAAPATQYYNPIGFA